MSGLIEIAASVLAISEQRLEVISHNVANTGTSGFKSQSLYPDVFTMRSEGVSHIFNPSPTPQSSNLQGQEGDALNPMLRLARMAQGKLTVTGNPFDLAISGQGFFAVRDGDGIVYTRTGQFKTGENFYLEDIQGRRVQSSDGQDIRIKNSDIEILSDGTVLENSLPVASVGVFGTENLDALVSTGGTDFRSRNGDLSATENAQIRQGMLEASNVTLSDEMVRMMEALRQAEVGSQLIKTYDTLMGQAISTFGQGTG